MTSHCSAKHFWPLFGAVFQEAGIVTVFPATLAGWWSIIKPQGSDSALSFIGVSQ